MNFIYDGLEGVYIAPQNIDKGRVAVLKIALLIILLLVSGCTTTVKPVLGDAVTTTPGWSRLKQSSSQAFRDPDVWATLLGAVLLQVDDADRKLSDQLRENTPIFGSEQKAGEASDDFQSLTKLAYISTAILVPGPETTGEWFSTKAKLLGSEWLAVNAARAFTSGMKGLSQRDRPNDLNDRSFPSGHATKASIQAQMANLNVEYLPIEPSSKQALGFTFDSFAALTAWARVEAGMHYPSDVLAGWAVGHYVAHLAQDFIDPDQQQVLVTPMSTNSGSGIQLVIRF